MIPLVLAAATGLVGIIGWVFWRGDGKLRRGSGERIRPHEAALPDDAFGAAATMLLFGSEQDERTALVRQQLNDMVAGLTGVAVAEVDLTRRGDLAGRFGVTRTPTVFALDDGGRLRARVTGAADLDTLRAALDTVFPPAA
ncbi:TlpA family protein disulfide reductase [uncultured Amnibacterium sp.]|uniref:TlpA family protein disulfide reductase n=1 Tax=uncultured Amnibacterium sp. TaxID=1631851 RepID=UPI0035CB5BC1